MMTIHHERKGVDSDDRYVRSRAEDRSMWIKTAYILEKYKLLVWILGLIGIAIGFQFKTPAMIVNELQGQITRNKAQVDDVIIPRVDSLQLNTNILLKLQCLDPKITPQQRLLVGLNCKNLLGQDP